jgi:type IV secretory pathway VirB2 component (pilin)
MQENRGPIAALIVVVLVVAAGLWLSQHLRANARIQDCVMAGRTNCAPIATPPRP